MPGSSSRVLIATVPFGEVDPEPLARLDSAGVAYTLKPETRRYNEDEMARLLPGFDAIIAGLDPLTDRVMASAPQLRLIARVGIGLDSVDLAAARSRGIAVSYTPDAPAAAVAELSVGLMLALLRSIPQADRAIRAGGWPRILGRRLGDLTVGIIGAGRVGRQVIREVLAFGARVLVSDPHVSREALGREVAWTEKDDLLRQSDLVSLHLPLAEETRGLVGARELALMRPGALIVNTSRGELIDEAALIEALRSRRLGGAALDVFRQEPYKGELAALDNTILTSHLGSSTADCRARMEMDAVGDVLRFLAGQPLRHPAP